MRPYDAKSYFVLLRWNTDRPGVYVGHHFTQWRLWFHLRPKARFARIDMHDPQAHRFIDKESAQIHCDAMPDLCSQKHLLSIAELRK